jgi:hypothetical protein
MLTDFYVAFATVCFTLLGLWIIVVQTRHGEWRHSAIHRRRAYGVALHFSLPGLMSLLSLVDPASTALWRISFAIVAAGGAVALALVRGPAPTRLGAAAYVAAVVLYLLIALVAVAPGMVADLGVLALPLRVEAVLLTILVFLGVNVAWLLLFDQAPPPSGLECPTRPVRDDTRASQRRRCTAARRASHWSPPLPLDTLLFGDFQLDLTASLLECSRRWLYQAPCGALEACVCTQVLHPSVGRHCRMIRIRRSRAFFSEGRRCGPALVLQRDGAGRGRLSSRLRPLCLAPPPGVGWGEPGGGAGRCRLVEPRLRP